MARAKDGSTMVSSGARSPAMKTLGTVLLIVVLSGSVVLWTEWSADTAAESAFASSRGYRVWAVVIAVSFAVWVRLALKGFSSARQLAVGRAAARVAKDVFIFVSIVGIAVVLLQVVLVAGRELHVPADGHQARIFLLIAAAATVIAPWLISTWIVQERVNSVSADIRNPSSCFNAADTVQCLLSTWVTIERAILALAVLVSTVVLNTAALRAALVPTVLTDRQFPSTDVLLYGAFFAMLLAFAVVPVLLAWRTTARNLVARTVGALPNGEPDDQWLRRRERMQQLLHLDVSWLRASVTALSILSPFLTALATAYVPAI